MTDNAGRRRPSAPHAGGGKGSGGHPRNAPRRASRARVQTMRSGEFSMQPCTVGIDLGTSATCVATVVDGKPVVIPSRQGTNTTPSILSVVPSGATLVGHAAARRLVLAPERTVYGSKRLVGRAFTEDLAAQVQGQFAYTLARTADHHFGAAVDGKVISMQDVSATVLREVAGLAESFLGRSIDGAVITVPAYFGDAQREAVRRAAKDARLPLIRIITEPTAAALAYGFHRGSKSRLAVVDLGAGTLDVSIVDVCERKFDVVATGGDTMLGGMDIDHAIMGFLHAEFMRQHRCVFTLQPEHSARLLEAARDAKIGLSQAEEANVLIPIFAEVGGELRDLRVTLTRPVAEELARDVLDRMATTIKEVLESASIPLDQIDDVLFIGGATRWPPIRARIEALFGRRGNRRTNPDEAVAMGAALVADDAGTVELSDVVPLSIGFAGSGRRFFRLIARNTSVPASRSFVVSTSEDDQAEYVLPMFQGESHDAAQNEYIGCLVMDGLPPGPKGSRSFELTIEMDEQCMMTCQAVEVGTGEPYPVRIDRTQDPSAFLEGLPQPTNRSGVHENERGGVVASLAARVRSLFG